ncbi:alpha/beta hydrolase [Chloroflexota bacterium]
MKVAAIGAAVALATYTGLSIFGAIAIMEIPRLPLNGSPASVGLAYEDISFTSRDDGVILKGWYIPAEGNLALIIVHGGFQNRVDNILGTLDLAHDLVQKGYNLLLFDLRGRGESEGKGRSLSNIDRDIGGAVDYLKNKGYPTSRIGIIGFCSSAASSCLFASQESIGGLVLDGCFASVQNMVDNQAAQRGIPQFLLDFFMPGVLLAAKTIYCYDAVNPIGAVARVTCPILFIHEEYDELVTLEDNFQLLKASGNPLNVLWKISGVEHSQAYKTYPSEYVERIDKFFAIALNETPH